MRTIVSRAAYWPAVILIADRLMPASAHAQTSVDAAAAAPAIQFKLPQDLSPWGMFVSADVVVKAVMIGLAFASVLT